MKLQHIKNNISIFILAVMIIIVYKTFDSIGILFGYVGRFLSLLIPIFISMAIAFILHPICRKAENLIRKMKVKWLNKHCRGIAVAIIYILVVALFAGFFRILWPMLFKSLADLALQLPTIVNNISGYLYSLDFGGYTLHGFLDTLTVENLVSHLNLNNVKAYMTSIAGFSKGIFNIFLALIISIYILLDRKGFKDTMEKLSDMLIPQKSKAVVFKYINRILNIMYKYVYCQLLEVLIVFLLALIALLIMRVDYAVVLSVFIGVFNLIPYFGAIFACALTALLTVFASSLSKGIAVAIVLIIMQQIDANIIQPKLVRDTLKVKPFWVLCGVSVGGGLFGIVGILLAVPVMALIKTIFEDCYDYYVIKSKQKESEPHKIQE